VFLKLFTLFIVVPLIELTLLLALSEAISWQYTLLIVVASGALGAFLARMQGWRTYTRIRRELATGNMPTDSLLDALLIFFAGGLLLTPGVLTDVFGMTLLIPFFRNAYKRWLVHWFKSRVQIHTVGMGNANDRTADPDRTIVIDSYIVDHAPDDEKPEQD